MEVELGYFMNEFVEIKLKALSYNKKHESYYKSYGHILLHIGISIGMILSPLLAQGISHDFVFWTPHKASCQLGIVHTY